MTAQVIRGNALDLPLADNSVDLIVTSPPYFGLRSYQDTCAMCRELERTGDDPRTAYPDWTEHTRKFHHYAGQIGAEATPAEFVDALVAATREMIRVLKPSGSIWVNLGDKYASGGRGTYDLDPGRREVAASRPQDGARPKSLLGIPWRYAIRCIDELGLILRAEVIWSKPNGLPESVTDRVRRSHETWFHFTKEPRYYSAVDEVREPYAPASIPRRSRGREHVYEAPGQLRHKGLVEGHNERGALPPSVWTIPTEPLRVPDHLGIDHFAAFPTEWPRRIITGWSPRGVCVECGAGRRPVVDADRTGVDYSLSAIRATERVDATAGAVSGGTQRSTLGHQTTRTITGEACDCPEPTAPTTPGVVLDPFGGTGTTALVADVLGRQGISVDMSADYCRLAEWRTTDTQQRSRMAARAATCPRCAATPGQKCVSPKGTAVSWHRERYPQTCPHCDATHNHPFDGGCLL